MKLPAILFTLLTVASLLFPFEEVAAQGVNSNYYLNNPVGIGTNNPGSQLHILKTSTNLDSAIRVSRNDSIGEYAFMTFDTGKTAYFGSKYTGGTKGEIRFQIADLSTSLDAMAINNAGLVGIGQTNPQYKLDTAGGDIHTNRFLRVGAWDWNDVTKTNTSAYGTGTAAFWYAGPDSTLAYPNSLILTGNDKNGGGTNPNLLLFNSLSIGSALLRTKLDVVSNSATSPIVANSFSSYDTFSVLPWASTTYLGTGLYYLNGTWIHQGNNSTNGLLGFSGASGGIWYASKNNTNGQPIPGWNESPGVTLWDSKGKLGGAGVFSNGDVVSSGPWATLGLYTQQGSLPSYPSSYYPTLKTSYPYLYIGVGPTGGQATPGEQGFSAYFAANGVNNVSDKNQKENFKNLSFSEILKKIKNLPVTEWNFKTEDNSIKHIGPTAQDFHATFGLGDKNNDKAIGATDAIGVSLAGVKGLIEENEQLKEQLKEQDQRIDSLEQRLQKLEKK